MKGVLILLARDLNGGVETERTLMARLRVKSSVQSAGRPH